MINFNYLPTLEFSVPWEYRWQLLQGVSVSLYLALSWEEALISGGRDVLFLGFLCLFGSGFLLWQLKREASPTVEPQSVAAA